MKKTFITTSIAYINAEPHIGFLLELLSADVLARYYRRNGDEVFFLTGTDEHGLKIQQVIEKSGQQPQAYADQIAKKFEQLSADFSISNDYFVRTTNPEHKKEIQEYWQQLQRAGVLEKRSYTGYYCTGCEAFKTEREIVDGKCSIHAIPVEKLEEENWFLITSDGQRSTIKEWIKRAVHPVGRQKEVINWLESGAFDAVSVSRPKDKLWWGIEVPGDADQVMYVWVDALFNYLTGLKLAGKAVDQWWPAAFQLIGKDILKFHAIIWPALLLATNHQLPKKLLVHGFVTVDGKKMSKSLGNVIAPANLLERYGVDGTRYLLLRQLSFYDDSNFSYAEFDAVYNGELANGVGNLASRTVSVLQKIAQHRAETVKSHVQARLTDPQLGGYISGLEAQDFAADLLQINQWVNQADAWITQHKPWEWLKQGSVATEQIVLLVDQSKLSEIAYLLVPYLPETAKSIASQLQSLTPSPLFPRLIGH